MRDAVVRKKRERLEVRASNAAAVAVYRGMGYEVANEEMMLGLFT